MTHILRFSSLFSPLARSLPRQLVRGIAVHTSWNVTPHHPTSVFELLSVSSAALRSNGREKLTLRQPPGILTMADFGAVAGEDFVKAGQLPPHNIPAERMAEIVALSRLGDQKRNLELLLRMYEEYGVAQVLLTRGSMLGPRSEQRIVRDLLDAIQADTRLSKLRVYTTLDIRVPLGGTPRTMQDAVLSRCREYVDRGIAGFFTQPVYDVDVLCGYEELFNNGLRIYIGVNQVRNMAEYSRLQCGDAVYAARAACMRGEMTLEGFLRVIASDPHRHPMKPLPDELLDAPAHQRFVNHAYNLVRLAEVAHWIARQVSNPDQHGLYGRLQSKHISFGWVPSLETINFVSALVDYYRDNVWLERPKTLDDLPEDLLAAMLGITEESNNTPGFKR